MDLSDLDYDLPADRIAQRPVSPRAASGLLVVRRGPGTLGDHGFRDLPELLAAGDRLGVNDSRVVPARIYGRRRTGGRVELLLLRREPGGDREALVRTNGSLRPGERLDLDGEASVTLVERPYRDAVWRVRPACAASLERALERAGHVPLPPYVRRADTAQDRERYQTVYARPPGSAAAPTAGLHFTPEVLERLRERGIARTQVTLHVGYGTFQPIQVARVEDHRLHTEDFEVTGEAAAAIRERRGRLVAVGTTTARVLETLARSGGVRAARGRTDLYLHPGRELRGVDVLLTNFHLPRSSLLLLVCAFAGRELVLEAYRHAIRGGYRFYSYGDAMLIL
ncbi:MAG: tRNA preQ1(34) S-adenosylmethionine ribosyltransferase-isomerase QueA [Planctomycetota bacterium]